MTEKNIIDDISQYTKNITKKNIKLILNSLFQYVIKEIISTKRIKISNFGSFILKKYKSKKGCNPNNPEIEINIPERWIIKFQPSKNLKDKLLSKK